jgi:periplasmic copper chaperone A
LSRCQQFSPWHGLVGSLGLALAFLSGGAQAKAPTAPKAAQAAPKAASGAAPAASAATVAPRVQVSGAWIRPAVSGQSGTGGFLTLTSAQPASLVAVSSPVAGLSQLHQMSMDGDVMRMDEIPAINLPAGKPVALKSGGMHLMLMKLKQPLKVGDKVKLTLTFKDAAGQTFQQELEAPVQMSARKADH